MIRIEKITKSFGLKTVFNQVSFHFPEGEKISLVGANGAGKSTLLDVLTGVQSQDSGDIIKPSKLRLGFLPQESNPNPLNTVLEEVLGGGDGFIQSIYRNHQRALSQLAEEYSERNFAEYERIDNIFRHEGGYSLEADAQTILRGLGFSEELIHRDPKSLSGGWRMRGELAKILIGQPNFLILDEPTNHLDLPSLAWVEQWLIDFKGTLLFVSHDRSLLERLASVTLHLNSGLLTPYTGNFSSFLTQREERRLLTQATQDTLKKQREHLQSFVDRFGAKATKAKQAQSRVKMIERIRAMEDDIEVESDASTMALKIHLGEPSGREVLKTVDLSIGYHQVLASQINLLVERGQRIAIIGSNGIGKSTFLKTIVGKIPQLNGQSSFGHNVQPAWFAQDQIDTLNPEKSVFDNIAQAHPSLSDQEIRKILGALLFRGDDIKKSVKVLSGGERARVGLAKLLGGKSNFLLLDEPTNHLDLSSVEILIDALAEYTGTMVFVSHDREFIDAVCTHVFVMTPEGRCQLFEGKLADYQAMSKLSGFPDVLSRGKELESKSSRKSETPQQNIQREQQKKSEKNAKKRLEIESKLEDLAKQKQSLEFKMASLTHDYEALNAIQRDLDDILSKTKTLEEQWLDVE